MSGGWVQAGEGKGKAEETSMQGTRQGSSLPCPHRPAHQPTHCPSPAPTPQPHPHPHHSCPTCRIPWEGDTCLGEICPASGGKLQACLMGDLLVATSTHDGYFVSMGRPSHNNG